MKTSKTKFMLITAITLIGMVGVGSAQSGAFGDYAKSTVDTSFNTASEQVAFEFSNISDEAVNVELLNGDNVTTTVEDVNVDSSGLGTVMLQDTYDVDGIAVYPDESDATSVESVTFYYDYSGTDPSDTTNYASDTVFDSFEYTDSSTATLNYLLPFIIVIAIIGMFTDL